MKKSGILINLQNVQLIAGVFVLLLSSCSPTKSLQSEEFTQIQRELTNKLTEISNTAGFNGFGIALVNDKEVLYQNGFGLANIKTKTKYTENTVQNIASVSKTFIGIAVLKAQELGNLQLDDPINKYLPFEVINPEFPNIPITIRYLVTHSSSIVDSEEYLNRNIILKDTTNLASNLRIDILPTKFNPPSTKISLKEYLQNLLAPNGKWYSEKAFSQHKPGSIYEYSNVGSSLAALVLEEATNMSYSDFTTKYILKPLKMNSSGWDFNSINFSAYSPTYIDKETPYPYYLLNGYPDGGMLTTSSDMSKYISELMKAYFGNGTILSKESYKEYYTPQFGVANFVRT